MTSRRHDWHGRVARTAVAFACLASAACGDDAGTTDATASAASSASGASSTGVAGAGGGGGAAGSGGGPTCGLGESEPCYDGPSGTADVGACKSGTRSCLGDGSGFSACFDEIVPAHEHCVTGLDENCDGAAPACPGPDASWTQAFGTPTFDVRVSGRGLGLSPSGDIVALFYFDPPSPCDFGGGPVTGDAVIARFGPGGDLVSSRGVDGALLNQAAFASNGAYVVGGYSLPGKKPDLGGGAIGKGSASYELVLGRFDAADGHVWSKAFDGVSDMFNRGLRGIAVDAADRLVVVGEFDKTMNLGGAPLSASGGGVYLGVLDASGAHVWSKGFESTKAPPMQSARGVGIDSAGSIVIAGTFNGTADFGGGPLVSNDDDIYVAKFDADGNHVWSERFGAQGNQRARAIVVDSQDRIVLAGGFDGTVDFGGGALVAMLEGTYLAILGPDGSHVQSRMFETAPEGDSFRMALGPGDAAFLYGDFIDSIDLGLATLTSAGQRDLFVAKFSASGDPVWTRAFGGSALDFAGRGDSIAVDGLGRAHLIGEFGATIDFGQGPITSLGYRNAFLAKIDP